MNKDNIVVKNFKRLLHSDKLGLLIAPGNNDCYIFFFNG